MDKFMNKPKCVTGADGTKSWYVNGKRHREDGPALIFASGTRYWYLNDKLHREDGPAIIFFSGSKFWYLNGKCHREDDPAVICIDGTKEWWLNNKKINPYICSFIVDMNKVEQKLFTSESAANKFMIKKLGEGIVAWMNL